jgi:hypothetical protein
MVSLFLFVMSRFTNCLSAGDRCALIVTRGFGDLLQIGNQSRPRIFDLEISKPQLLYEQVVEVDERIRLGTHCTPNTTLPFNCVCVAFDWIIILLFIVTYVAYHHHV